MRHVTYIVAAATLAVVLTGCGDPYYPRYGYSQSYYAPSGYNYAPLRLQLRSARLQLRSGEQQQLQLKVRLLPQLQRYSRRAGTYLSVEQVPEVGLTVPASPSPQSF